MNPKENKPSIVIVLGMHRSGTSAVTNLIASLGFDAGDNLMPPDEDNQKGYWEDNDIIRLNNEILSYLFVSWDQTEELLNRRLYVFCDSIVATFKEKAIKLIKQKLNRSNKIVIKDPRFNILIPFWNMIFEELNVDKYYLLVVRNPLSVAKSLLKRNSIEEQKGLLLWYYYNLTVFYDLSSEICIVPIEQLVENQEKELAKICQFLKISNITPDHINARWKEIFDNNLIHLYFTMDQIKVNTQICPHLYSFYEYLIDNSNISCVISPDNNFYSQNFKLEIQSDPQNATSTRLFSTVFYENRQENAAAKNIQKSHESGFQIISFIFDDDNNSNEINIFLCDKPCVARIDQLTIKTKEKEIIIKHFEGNFIFRSKNIYIFEANTPCIRFLLPHPEHIKQIELIVFLEVDKLTVSSYIIPFYKFAAIENHQLQHQIKLNEVAINEALNARDIYIQENKEFKNQIALLKKPFSKKYLYRNFQSRKLFVRTIGNSIQSIYNKFHLLINKTIRNSSSKELEQNNKAELIIENIDNIVITKEHELFILNYPQLKFEKFEKPLVSIIIPVFNQWFYTYRCLKSILENTRDVEYEIIIADDASTDSTKNLSLVVKNIVHLRNQNNLLFLANCNNATKYAKGKYIHLLNNDVQVHKNWLSSLVTVIENDEKIGLIGSKLLYPNGKLQEAGGIIWDDASGCNYGHMEDPEKAEFNYLKETDYISGASILVRKKLWEQLNGFDERFSPAYYEDTDLAFRIREAGYKVIYQPLSIITHYEGISHGRNVNNGLKKHQTINQKKFFDKWKDELIKNHYGNSQRFFLARDRSKNKKQVLVIDHYIPNFDKDAGSRSTFSYIKLLVEMGFTVKFYGDYSAKLEPYTTTLLQLGVEVLYGDYYQYNFHQWIANNGIFLDYVILNRMHIAPKHLNAIIEHSNAKIAYVGHDLHFIDSRKKFERTGELRHYEDSLRFFEIEKYLFNNVDCIFPFSTFEAPFIKEIVPHKIVQPIPVFFFDKIPSKINTYMNRKDILFIGGFDHRPNVDSIIWFVNDVFPKLLSQIKDIKLYILGSNPNDEVKRLASDSIIVTGFITDGKLKEYYSNCRISILPLQYGAGVKGKLLEALYYQIPTVITKVAAEGVPEIEKCSLIADKSDDFASRIYELYNNNSLWSMKSKNSKKLILKYYTKENAKSLLTKTLFSI